MKNKPPSGFDARKAARIMTFNKTSALAGRLADMRLPRPMLRAFISAYSSWFGVDLSEARQQKSEFGTFGDFFARELKEGERPVNETPRILTSPCDGTLHNYGDVDTNGCIPQVKGHDYSVAELLQDEGRAADFLDGTYATIYLSPSNYHRVHAPAAGSISYCRHIPGALYSVSTFFVSHMKNLFVTNERIPIYLDTEHGKVCVVMVGATIVGRVKLNFCDLQTNRDGAAPADAVFSPPLVVDKAADLGAFHLGSTVVMLMESKWKAHMLAEGMPVRMGAPLFALPKGS